MQYASCVNILANEAKVAVILTVLQGRASGSSLPLRRSWGRVVRGPLCQNFQQLHLGRLRVDNFRILLTAPFGNFSVSRLNRIARMERTRRSLTDAANLLSITDLLNRSIRTVIDEWAKESVGLPGTNGSPKILPSHELHQAQRTILAICGTLTELVAEPASRVIEVACGYWESRALYIAAERRIPDLLSRAGEGGMSAKELGKVTGIESAKLGGCFSLTERGRGCLFRNMWLMHPGSRTARTLRCLCSIHFFREVAPDCFANNSISQSLVGNEPLRAYVLLL